MGVLRFFKYVLKKYKRKAITSIVKQDNQYRQIGLKQRNPDVLLVDCNAVFHPACRSVFDPSSGSLLRPSQLTDEQKKLRAFREVCKLIEKIIQVGSPEKAVYLAIDGVAGLCKQTQQRKRRFKSALDALENPGAWDSSVLTVGTSFMNELSLFMKQHFATVPLYGTAKRRLRIIFNSQNIPGEGEHKLVRFVENDRQYRSYCIYSPDADLIMLGMLLPKDYVTILRENIYQDEAAEYFLVNIYHLKQEFYNDYRQLTLLHVTDPQKQLTCLDQFTYIDLVLFFFMLGNDFLPHVSCIDIVSDGIDTLMQTYVLSMSQAQNGSLVSTEGKLEGQFNMPSLLQLLDQLQVQESELLLHKYNTLKCPIPDTVLHGAIRTEDGSLDFMKYRSEYYKRNFGNDQEELIHKICDEYLRGLIFVIRYYSKCIPTFDWYYPYHYAPLFYDLYEYVSEHHKHNKQIEYRFDFQPPLTQHEALISVLHPNSFGLIPIDKVREFMKTRALIDANFPTTFEVDLEGKLQSYEGVILLPMISYNDVRSMLKKFKLTDPADQVVDLIEKSKLISSTY